MAPLLGFLLVLLVAGAVTLFLRIRAGLRRSWSAMRAHLLVAGPARITLVRQENFKWLKGDRALVRVAAFEALGFEALGGFSLTENPGARLLLLHQRARALIAVVREHDPVGTWSEVFRFQRDRPEPVAASNVLKSGQFRLLAGEPKFHRPDATEAELVKAVEAASPVAAGAFLPDLAAAVSLLEEAHALAADRRLLEPLEDYEIRRLLREDDRNDGGEAGPAELEEEDFKRIKAALPAVLANELRLTCRAQFLREGLVSAREWQAAGGRILVVHELTPLRELARRRTQAAHCTPELRRRLRRAPAAAPPAGVRMAFAALNAALPPAQRYRKLGEVARPVAADIYAAPLPRAST